MEGQAGVGAGQSRGLAPADRPARARIRASCASGGHKEGRRAQVGPPPHPSKTRRRDRLPGVEAARVKGRRARLMTIVADARRLFVFRGGDL